MLEDDGAGEDLPAGVILAASHGGLPRELSADQRRELVRAFVGREFVARGMVADVAIHCPKAEDGLEQPHAHVLLTMRGLTPEGFGGKVREWNDKAVLERWREQWATVQNHALERAGLEQRVDHRTLEAQGRDLEPTMHLGPAAHALERRGQPTEIGDHNRAVAERNSLREQLREAARIVIERFGQAVEVAHSLARGDIRGMLEQIREYSREAETRHRGDVPLEAHRNAAERSFDRGARDGAEIRQGFSQAVQGLGKRLSSEQGREAMPDGTESLDPSSRGRRAGKSGRKALERDLGLSIE